MRLVPPFQGKRQLLQRNRLFFLCSVVWSSATVGMQAVTAADHTKGTRNALSTPARGGSTNMSVQDNDPWGTLGGGAVNEKKRHYEQGQPEESTASVATAAVASSTSNYDPSKQRSHLWHALEGMDRYPNYLARWKMDDVDQLEGALEKQLERVRQQRQSIQERRDGIDKLVLELVERDGQRWETLLTPPSTWDQVRDIMDPKSVTAIFRSQLFAGATVQEVLSGHVDIELDVAKLQVLMDEEFDDVFSFRLLSTAFCKDLRDFVTALTELGQSSAEFADLQVGRRPVDFDTVGLSWVNDLLFHMIMRPISRHLFQTTESLGDLDWRQGYVAGYSASPTEGKPRERLVTHTDDSEVTLNVGLGDEFEGGELEFRGIRGTKSETDVLGTFKPEPGLALLHPGRQFHDVSQVTSGDRFALIIWARSWKGSRAQTCPCCWLNRRQDKACVCGPRWN